MQVIPFEQHEVVVFGRRCQQPRLTKWYAPIPYTYSGLTLEPAHMPDLVKEILDMAEYQTGAPINSVLCNLYRDGQDGVGWHADDESLFGPSPEVVSVSFGAERLFKMRLKSDHQVQREFELGNRTLFHMPAGTQELWEHCIPRTKMAVGPRINLTFRQVLVR
jgi:alkylated DNA repair dioxygenase AlkB